MNYKIYKLKFTGAVHFGAGTLEDGEYVFYADTLFSALCQEALKKSTDCMDELVRYVKDGSLLLSDAFPYIGEIYCLPKPMKRVESKDNQGNSIIKKAFKKLKYIPMEKLEDYLKGEYDVLNGIDMRCLGKFEMKVSASIRGEAETKPYRVGTYYFNEECGLYFIAGYENDNAWELLRDLMERLSFSGIGGKRSAGMGRFECHYEALSEKILKRLGNKGDTYMTMSVSLPKEDEMEEVISDADYLLCRRSGFVASENYAEEMMRKKDLYVLKSGSCVHKKYDGDIYDVSDHKGRHEVYRYAKPLFMEVDA